MIAWLIPYRRLPKNYKKYKSKLSESEKNLISKLLKNSSPPLIALDIVGVQPMSKPSGLIFAMKSVYTPPSIFKKIRYWYRNKERKLLRWLGFDQDNIYGNRQSFAARRMEIRAECESLGLTHRINPKDLDWDNEHYISLKSLFKDGDTLWGYNSMACLAGQAGVVIFRNDEVIGGVVTMIS